MGFHDPDLFEFVLKKVGEDHILFSSDYPFNSPKREIDIFNGFDMKPYKGASSDSSIYSAFAQNVAMSVMFLTALFQRETKNSSE